MGIGCTNGSMEASSDNRAGDHEHREEGRKPESSEENS
jgi:hypothetical protein